MTAVTELYIHAQVAVAAYANVYEEMAEAEYREVLRDAGMGAAQARTFVSDYRVVDQYDGKVVETYVDEFGNEQQATLDTGLSVTLFQRLADGHRVVAIRGTDITDPGDIKDDLLLLLGDCRPLPQYAALKAKVQEWLEGGQLSPGFTVTGHSLGGFLATGLTATFGSQIAGIYAYNAPGLAAVLNGAWSVNWSASQALQLLRLFSVSGSGVDPSRITSVRASPGISPIAGLGTSVGARVDVPIEDQTSSSVWPKELALNHSQATITEALAVLELLSRFKPSLTIGEGSDILHAASISTGGMLEGVTNALLKLFGKTPIADVNASRDELYQAIADMSSFAQQEGESGSLTLEALAGRDKSQVASLGHGDIAFRYALKEVNPFAVTGADYSSFDRDGALSMFDPATGSGALTSEWLRDRAELLYWHLVRNRDDVQGVVRNPGGEALELIDRRLVEGRVVEERIRVGVSIAQPRTLAFGSERADEWSGSGYADGLYGGGGDDRLAGLGGEDYLQGDVGSDFLLGGAGHDTLVGGKDTDVLLGGTGADLYRWRKGDGADYLIDFTGDGFGGDGEGTIEFLASVLTGSLTITDESTSQRIYSGPAGLTYTLTGTVSGRGILTIAKLGEPGDVSILGFRSGELGLTLEAPTPLDKSLQAGTPGADTLWSTTEREQVLGYEANDRITLSHAQSEGYGGEGHDYLTDDIGEQELYGEAGRDILIGSLGADQLYGGDDADALQGGAGDDHLTAGADDDIADGGPGADVIEGGDGDDFLLGGGSLVPGIDWSPSGEPAAFGALVLPGQITGVQGMAGELNVEGDEADLIDGGAGHDTVLAGDGGDLVLGGSGMDYLVGQAGDDSLSGEGGDDVLLGDGTEGQLSMGGRPYFTQPHAHGDDLLAGGLGNDHLEGDGGADQLYGNEGDDSLDGDSGWLDALYHGDDFLDGGEGNDWVTGSGGSDTLYGGAGHDWVQGDSSLVPHALKGNDFLVGGEGADRLIGDGGADQLFGEAGNDQLFGDADDNDVAYDGADVLDGGAGNDYLRGHGGGDVLLGGGGNDMLLGDGDGTRAGEVGNDTLVGGPGFDLMDGGLGDDRYEFNVGDGVDKIFDVTGINTVVFGAGISTSAITVQQGEDESGTYAVIGYGANDMLAVENGFTDGIQFYRFADGAVFTPAELARRLGRAQYVPLAGSANDETIASTGLLEVLDGGAGSDVYTFDARGGYDIVVEGGGNDLLRFDQSVSPAQVTYAHASNGDLVVTVTGGTEVRVEGHYLGLDRRVETIEFADGTILHTATLDALSIAPIAGSAGDDGLTGSYFADTFEGGPGRDTLMGGRGADTYVFRAGDGEDTILDGDGLGGGGDWLELRGFSRDSLRFERTVGGTLTIRSLDSDDRIVLPDFFGVANRIETIELFADTAEDLPDDRIQWWELSSLATEPVFGTDADDTFTGSDAADTFLGEDGNDSIVALGGNDLLFGGAGDDTLAGGSGADTLMGEEGADWLYGDGGDDSLDGGAGEDRLYGGDGEDTLIGGAGADELIGGSGFDRFEVRVAEGDALLDLERSEVIVLADVGDPWALSATSAIRDGAAGVLIAADAAAMTGLFVQGGLARLEALDPTFEWGEGTRMSYSVLMDDVFTADVVLVGTPIGDLLKGYAGHDTLRGLAGDDRLIGGAGDDLLEGGAGNDELRGGAGIDTLRGGAGDDTYTIDASDLVEEFAAEGFDTVVARFSATLGAHLEALQLAGSEPLDATGNAGANVLAGNDVANVLAGLEGDDTLLGNGGHDTLAGGPGADLLAGGTGDDLYVLSLGDGMDTLEDHAGLNVVVFGAGITAASLVAETYIGDDGATYLALAYGDRGDALAIRDGLLGAVRAYRFADGAVLTHRELLDTLGPLAIHATATDDTILGTSAADALDGRSGDDILYGGGADDVLRGGAGRDHLYGEAGEDTLEGGTGDDLLVGGAGADTYVLAWGTGADRIEEDGLEASHLRLGPGVGFDDLIATRAGNDLELALRGVASSAITVADYFVSKREWDVTSSSGETRLLADVLAASPSVPADPLAAIVAAYELRIKAAYFATLGALGFESNGDTFHSAATLFTESGTHTTYSSYGVRTVRQENDAPLIQRVSLPFESSEQTQWSESTLRVVSTSPGSRGVARALAQSGSGWRFVPAAESAPAVTMAATGIAVSRAGADYGSAQASALQGFWVPEASGPIEVPALPVPVQRVITITNTVSHETARLNLEEIHGGADSNSIWAGDYSVVDGGAGADDLHVDGDPGYLLPDTTRGHGRLGSLLYGNEGDDALAGGAGNDLLIGGAGDDTLSGGAGADTYAQVGEGSDAITDVGEDFARYRQSYFNTAHFSDLEVREAGGGRFLDTVAFAEFGPVWEARMIFDTPQEGLEFVLHPLERSLDFERDVYASLLAWDGTGAAPTYNGQTAQDFRKRIEQCEAEIAWEQSRYRERFVYVEPLPPLPILAGNDHAAIEPYYGSAVWVDRVELTQKWHPDTLMASTSEVDGEPGFLYLDHPDGERVTITLARAADPIGTGVEVIACADGTTLTIRQLLARASTPRHLVGTDGDDTLLGGDAADTLAGGDGADEISGHEGADLLIGFGGNDRLDGGAGADIMQGGAGDDTYIVDDAGDVVTENAEQGRDTILSAVTCTLPAAVENLVLTGEGPIDGAGNALDNVLRGNGAPNALAGGAGHDAYYVSAGDIVTERLGQGVDTVYADQNWSLGRHLENLTLTGRGDFNAIGNRLPNGLTGNSGDNWLDGRAGDDRLAGAGGTDTLVGGTGDDTYLLGRGDGVDTIVEHDATPGNRDAAVFLGGIAAEQIWLRRAGNDLEASVIGTADAFVLRDWYRGAARRVERFATSDGDQTLLADNVQALVDAMAAFAPPALGITTLPLDYHTALAPVFAANWQ